MTPTGQNRIWHFILCVSESLIWSLLKLVGCGIDPSQDLYLRSPT